MEKVMCLITILLIVAVYFLAKEVICKNKLIGILRKLNENQRKSIEKLETLTL